MILVKQWKLFHLLCLSKIHREKVFADDLDKTEALKTLKTTVYEKRKIRIYPKRLVHHYGPKRDFFNFDFSAK